MAVARMREVYEYWGTGARRDPRTVCLMESSSTRVSPHWNLVGEGESSATLLEQQLAEARFLAAFCCEVYAQRSPKTVCATAAQLLYDYFQYQFAHFSFADAELESFFYMPLVKASKRQESSNKSPFAPTNLKKRHFSLAGTAADSGFDITVAFPTGLGQLRILKAEQGSHEASEGFMQNIADCLAAALNTVLEHSRLQELSLRDGLTGLLNRRAFEELLDIETARREAPPLSLVMIDIDDFKSINDRFGHPAGDQVITAVGKALVETLRGADLAARYGGEEFAVLLPETTAKDAFFVAERLRSRIASLCFDFSGQGVKVTISLGVANRCEKDARSVRELLKLADESLYQAKRSGKNRTLIHMPAVSQSTKFTDRQ